MKRISSLIALIAGIVFLASFAATAAQAGPPTDQHHSMPTPLAVSDQLVGPPQNVVAPGKIDRFVTSREVRPEVIIQTQAKDGIGVPLQAKLFVVTGRADQVIEFPRQLAMSKPSWGGEAYSAQLSVTTPPHELIACDIAGQRFDQFKS